MYERGHAADHTPSGDVAGTDSALGARQIGTFRTVPHRAWKRGPRDLTGTRTASKAQWAHMFAIFALVAAVLIPYARRLGHASLYSDDVVRLSVERNLTFSQRLLLPCNEHLAPLFELVSTATWLTCAGRLTSAPLAFTASSFVPFVLVLGLLAWVIARETGSRFAACASVILFAHLPMHAEVVGWYSASSFAWALFATLLAYCLAGQTGNRAWLGCALVALAAPAFSAIGVLAGPVGCVRALVAGCYRRAIAPMFGTALYFGLTAPLNYHTLLARSVQKQDWTSGVANLVRAPIGALLMGVIGRRDIEPRAIGFIDALLAFGFLIGALALAIRARGRDNRSLILCGLFMIIGGYALTVLPRSGAEFENPLRIQRYQLFPIAGLVLMLAPALAKLDSALRLKERKAHAAIFCAALGASLYFVHRDRWDAYSKIYLFPQQGATLRAIERIESLAPQMGLDREHVLAQLPAVRPAWFDHPSMSFWMLVGPFSPAVGSAQGKPVKLRDALDQNCREAIWGGMNVNHLRIGVDAPPVETIVNSPNDATISTRKPPFMIVYNTTGRAPLQGAVAWLELPIIRSGTEPPARETLRAELFWATSDQDWSIGRSIQWTVDPTEVRQQRFAIGVADLPHWSGQPTRFLLMIRTTGEPLIVTAPALHD